METGGNGVSTNLEVDRGLAFGRWTDPTSRFMYFDIMPTVLSGVNVGGIVADLGGGNGLIKRFVPHAVTVDNDPTKEPDVLDDILTHRGGYDLVIVRYVLHYFSDKDCRRFFNNLADYHTGRVLLIQFVNENKRSKLKNSVNEDKYFRTEKELMKLLSPRWHVHNRVAIEYRVTAEFYRNRLGHPNPTGHDETILALQLGRDSK